MSLNITLVRSDTSRTLARTRLKRFLVGLGIFAISSAKALAVEAPYTDNFDSYATGSTPNNFSTQAKGAVDSADWFIYNPSGTSGVYENDIFGDDALSSAAINMSNLNNSDFLLSTTFVLDSYFAPHNSFADITAGVAALGFTSDFSRWGYDLSYEVFETGGIPSGMVTGSLELSRAGGGFAGNPFVTLTVTQGTTYTMTLSGHYTVSGLVLTGTLIDGNNSISLTATDPQPLQGTYFGYYDKASGQFNNPASLGVSYDNFSINVPEPPITWLVRLGTAVMGVLTLLRHQLKHRWSR